MRNGTDTAACQNLAADVDVGRQAPNASALEVAASRHGAGEAKSVLTEESWPKACSCCKGKTEPAVHVRTVKRDLLKTLGCVSGTMSHNLL